ncbi:hypothetical protein [Noviherbaspirillum denitrificans]|nr:hypothetical protein [Noviherbaspirillum denitrificans]
MMEEDPHAPVAVQAEALFLLNLLVLPGLSFAVLLWLAYRHRRSPSPLARCHLKQAVIASLWAGALLTAVAALILVLGGLHKPATWVVLILYFTCCHAALVLFGIVGLSRAMAEKTYVYPLIGSRQW